ERRELVELLTPVAKAWGTDLGVELTSLALQVHGGMGYVEETGAAQLVRDARIGPIYEGTNGIQAIDLVTRKLPMDDGRVVAGLLHRLPPPPPPPPPRRARRGRPPRPARRSRPRAGRRWRGPRLDPLEHRRRHRAPADRDRTPARR